MQMLFFIRFSVFVKVVKAVACLSCSIYKYVVNCLLKLASNMCLGDIKNCVSYI